MKNVDIIKAENLLLALKKATFNDMLGGEILALAQAIQWLKEEIKEAKKPPLEIKEEAKIKPILAASKKGIKKKASKSEKK